MTDDATRVGKCLFPFLISLLDFLFSYDFLIAGPFLLLLFLMSEKWGRRNTLAPGYFIETRLGRQGERERIVNVGREAGRRIYGGRGRTAR